MGLSGISPLSLLLILAIVIVLFGTKRLRHIAEDLGKAMRSFREGLNDTSQNKSEQSVEKRNEESHL